MSPREVERLGQYLAGTIGPDPTNFWGDGYTVPATPHLGDSPFPDTHPGAEVSWVLLAAAPDPLGLLEGTTHRHHACQRVSMFTSGELATLEADPAFYTTWFCERCEARFPVEDFTVEG